MSGSKESRPALNRLMTDAHLRRFDAILVWRLDRFGRSLIHLVNTVADLEVLGVSFISLHDGLELTTPSGRLMFHVVAALAQFELTLTRERVMAGLNNARRTGKQLGRPPRIVDFDSISRLKAEGHGLRTIAKKLGVGYGTVRMRLTSCERKTPNPGAATEVEV